MVAIFLFRVGRLFTGYCLSLLIIGFFSFSVYPRDSENMDEEALGAGQGFYQLEELINATVTVGSKKAEKASKTPAIVSVFTNQDIIDSGYDNLYDLLGTVPGVEIIESYYGQTMVLFRGVQQEHYNNKSLLIIDGHRIYEQTSGNYRLEQIPLNAIKRIEIIRGPGSALYGTNAYTGLINITTKKDFKTDEISIYQRFGLFNDSGDGKVKFAEYAEVSLQKTLGEDISISSHSSGKWHQSFIYTINEPEALDPSKPISKDYKNNFINTYNSFSWKGLNINAFFFQQDKSKYGTLPSDPFGGSPDHDDNLYYNVGGNIGYTQKFSDALSVDYKFFSDYYNFYSEVGRRLADDDEREQVVVFSGYKLILQTESSYQYNKHYSGILGFYAEYNQTDPFSFVNRVTKKPDTLSKILAPFQNNHFARYDLATYVQGKADYRIFSVTGGFRYNYNKDYEHSYAPRGGLNLTLYEEGSHGLFVKSLYGLAIRNPSFFETKSQSSIILGLENLKPESIHSVDLALEYIFLSHLSFRSNYFYNSSDDFIQRGSNAKGDPIYENTDGQVIHGIELDVKYYPLWGDYKKDFWLTTNVSYKTGTEKSNNLPINYLTPWLFNFRVDYRWEDFVGGPVHFGVIVKYVGERSGRLSNIAKSPQTPNAQNNVAGYTLVNLLIKWTFLKEWKSLGDQTLEFGVQNITNTSYVYPEVVRNRSNSVDGVTPFYPGRYFYFAYRSKLGL